MKFRIENQKLKIIDATRTEYHQLQIFLTRYADGYQYQRTFKIGVWDGTVSFFNNVEGIAFGLWLEVKNYMTKAGFKFEIENMEDFPIDKGVRFEDVQEWANDFFKNHKHPDDKNKPLEPYDYQLKAVTQILKYKYCNIEVGTGGGKSLIYGMFLFYYLTQIDPNAKFLIIVPTISLVKQFYNDLNQYNNGFYNEIKNPLKLRMHEVMSSKPREHVKPNIVIGTYQSLEKEDKKFFQQFNIVTIDECLHPDTLITMHDDSVKHIKDIQIGDFVKTYNEEEKIIEIKEVEYVYHNLSKNEQMYELEFENGNVLKITGNHKVYTINGWKRVDELNDNDDVLYIE